MPSAVDQDVIGHFGALRCDVRPGARGAPKREPNTAEDWAARPTCGTSASLDQVRFSYWLPGRSVTKCPACQPAMVRLGPGQMAGRFRCFRRQFSRSMRRMPPGWTASARCTRCPVWKTLTSARLPRKRAATAVPREAPGRPSRTGSPTSRNGFEASTTSRTRAATSATTQMAGSSPRIPPPANWRRTGPPLRFRSEAGPS